MLSNKAKYGLKALLYLAEHGAEGAVLISAIAEDRRIPKKFLDAILLEMKNNGLLYSKKGKGGGYSLAKSPDKITVGQVIRILDGPLAPIPCVSQTAYRRCEDCLDEAACGIRSVMRDVRDAIADILDNTTLADLATRGKGGEVVLMYEI